jgi:PST family polysaccharide transporter
MRQHISKKVILKSIKWSALSEILSKVLPPFFYIFTARLLTPEDFGLVATSAMVIAFASIIGEAGLSKALIQTQDISNIEIRANTVFYTNVFFSSLLYGLLIILSDPISTFFNDKRISEILKVSGLSLIIGSLMSVQIAFLQKDFEFKKLFFARFAGTIIPGIVSVMMAYFGYGYWSLVLGNIASMIIQNMILWKISKWRPTLTYNIKLAKEMFIFSRWVLLSGILSWFFMWGEIFVLGLFFSSQEVGLYRTGNYFVSTIIGLITTPIVPVMYSYFSKIQHDIESVKKALLFSSKVLSFFVLPIGVGIFIIKAPLVNLLFGEKWQGLDFVVGWLALMHSLSWIVGLNNEAYKALGRPDIETKILSLSIFIYLVGYFLSAQISFKAFVITRFVLAVLVLSFHIYASRSVLNLGYSETFFNIRSIFIISLLVFFVNIFLINFISFSMSSFLILFISILIYLMGIYFVDKTFFRNMWNIIAMRETDVENGFKQN